MTTIDRDYAKKLLADTRKRGMVDTTIGSFVASGEFALDVTETVEYFAQRVPAAVRNGMTQAIKNKSKENDWPTLTCLVDKDNDHVILINMDSLASDDDDTSDDSDNA